MQHWYCVHTKPRAEAQALEHLQRQGFECLLPRLQRTTLRNGRRHTGVEALFPRYLFLHADAQTTSLAPVRSTQGAVGLVRTAGLPATVPDEFIERLQADANADLQHGTFRFPPAIYAVAVAFSTFQVITAAFSPLSSTVVRALHVGFLLLMTFLLMPPAGRRWIGWIVGGIGFVFSF